MTQYIIRRLIQLIPIAFGILTLVFSLIHLIPGDPAVQIAGEGARPEDVVAIRKALGLDQPLWTQYVSYLTHVLRGDLGKSFQTNESVTVQIRQRYPATIQLALGAMLIALLVAFPLGIISAIYRNSWIDNLARFFALLGVSMPSFWFGPLLTSISNRDYPQVQASILVIALTYIGVNFISDLLYGVVDPRIKLE